MNAFFAEKFSLCVIFILSFLYGTLISFIKNILLNGTVLNTHKCFLVYSNQPSNGNGNEKSADERRSYVANCETEDCSQLGIRYICMLRNQNEHVFALLADNILKFLDPYANPCESFYHYVCGRHSNESPVPDTNAKYGVHEILIRKLNLRLKGDR